jgi:hypothetical protein
VKTVSETSAKEAKKKKKTRRTERQRHVYNAKFFPAVSARPARSSNTIPFVVSESEEKEITM